MSKLAVSFARLWPWLVVVAVLVGADGVAAQPAPAQDRDCGDFPTQAAAQAYFIARGGPTSDPDRLDADSDGVACESLPCPCSSGTAPTPTPTAIPTITPIPTATPAPSPTATPSPTPIPPGTRRSARIVRVIDGDTLRVRLASGRQITVRLIGVNAPEIKRPGVAAECGATRATAHLRKLALQRGRGRQVTIVSDPSQAATDRFGRTLSYVDADGKGDLGRLMVRAGWAAVYVVDKQLARAPRYEREAVRAKQQIIGVWDWCDGIFHRRG